MRNKLKSPSAAETFAPGDVVFSRHTGERKVVFCIVPSGALVFEQTPDNALQRYPMPNAFSHDEAVALNDALTYQAKRLGEVRIDLVPLQLEAERCERIIAGLLNRAWEAGITRLENP